jgi:hypothetical protein
MVDARRAIEGRRLRARNVLLVTIDTLRVDRVGACGNTERLTPTLDDLAARGIGSSPRERALRSRCRRTPRC